MAAGSAATVAAAYPLRGLLNKASLAVAPHHLTSDGLCGVGILLVGTFHLAELG